MEYLLIPAGLAVLAFAVWSRLAPAPGRTRWWTGHLYREHGVLAGLPGLGIMLVSAPFLAGYESTGQGLGDQTWLFWPGASLALGCVVWAWGALALPLPGFAKPAWFRVYERMRRDTERRLRARRRASRRAQAEAPARRRSADREHEWREAHGRAATAAGAPPSSTGGAPWPVGGWTELERRLADRIASLGDMQVLTVDCAGLETREAVLRPRQLFGLVAERRGPVRPFLEVLDWPGGLIAELTGSPATGGVYPWRPEEEDRIVGLGWGPLIDPRNFSANYQVFWPTDGAEGAAGDVALLLVRTLRDALRCGGPGDVALTGPHLRRRPLVPTS